MKRIRTRLLALVLTAMVLGVLAPAVVAKDMGGPVLVDLSGPATPEMKTAIPVSNLSATA